MGVDMIFRDEKDLAGRSTSSLDPQLHLACIFSAHQHVVPRKSAPDELLLGFVGTVGSNHQLELRPIHKLAVRPSFQVFQCIPTGVGQRHNDRYQNR
jgi:hypothetical protein